MKINSKILSIPPYISTSWENVSSIQMEEKNLIIVLKNGRPASIPNLPGPTIEEIFNAHAEYLDQGIKGMPIPPSLPGLSGALNIGLAPGSMPIEGMENFTGMMQHDPNQKDAPPLPKEILDKISGVGKALGLNQEAFHLPESEPHCNCPFCQIARAMHGEESASIDSENDPIDEDVSDAELKFREWDIVQVDEKLYEVRNPLDQAEHYQVYLGQPIGCTCGKNNCDHVIAVLNS